MRKSTEDIEKLPKWAQDLIGKLNTDVEWYKNMAFKVRDKSSSIWYGFDSFIKKDETKSFIPEESKVVFELDERNSIELTVKLDGMIMCHLSSYNMQDMLIIPESRNSILVGVKTNGNASV